MVRKVRSQKMNVLVGLQSEEDWFDIALRLIRGFYSGSNRRGSLHAGRGIRLEDVDTE